MDLYPYFSIFIGPFGRNSRTEVLHLISFVSCDFPENGRNESYDLVNPLNTNRRPLYLKTQSVPRCKHFSSRL